MSRARDVADGALGTIAGTNGQVLTSDGNNWSGQAVGTSDSTLGTLTQAFSAGQQTTINLASNALSPSVAVIKEVPQSGVTNNQWNVDSAGSGNYTRYNTASATTISFSGTTATLGSGSFSASDVGKTIEVNNGKLVLTNVNGTFAVASTPDNYNTAASGAWQMYGLVFNATDTDLEISNATTNTYNLTTASYLHNQALSSFGSIASPEGISFSSTGHKLYVYCSNTQKIFEFDLATNYDVTTLSLRANFSTSSNFTEGMDLAISTNGSKMFLVAKQFGRCYSYDLSTAFDITSCGNFTLVRNLASGTENETTPSGICFSADGTKMYITGIDNGKVYQYAMTTGFDGSTLSYVSGTSLGSINPHAITLKPDGSIFYVFSQQQNAVRFYTATSNFDFSSVGYTSQFGYGGINNGTGIQFNGDGSRLNILDSNFDYINVFSVGSLIHASGYQAAHTTNSVDSTTWTDINSMTATESAGSGTINYAVSTDDRITWKIAHNTSGVRGIVKNNSGTWQYNSNATYASETWVNGSTNNELATLQEAMGTAQNTMNKAQLDAVSDVTHFPVSNDLDLAIILNLTSGTTVPASDGVSINYDAAVANQGAILGTDYNYDVPALNKVRITAVNAATLKVRVV